MSEHEVYHSSAALSTKVVTSPDCPLCGLRMYRTSRVPCEILTICPKCGFSISSCRVRQELDDLRRVEIPSVVGNLESTDAVAQRLLKAAASKDKPLEWIANVAAAWAATAKTEANACKFWMEKYAAESTESS